MILKTLAIFCIVVWYIYYLFYKEPNNFFELSKRGIIIRALRLKKQELNLYRKYEHSSKLADHYRDIQYIIGIWYAKEKRYREATDYFNRALIGYQEQFTFKKEFFLVIDSYLRCNDLTGAKEIYQLLMQREVYDLKFQNLKKRYGQTFQ